LETWFGLTIVGPAKWHHHSYAETNCDRMNGNAPR
jgi:hypothetical protein